MLYRHGYYVEYEYKLAWYLPMVKGVYLADVENLTQKNVCSAEIVASLKRGIKEVEEKKFEQAGKWGIVFRLHTYLRGDLLKLTRIDLLYSVPYEK